MVGPLMQERRGIIDTLHRAFLWPNQMVKERNKHTLESKTAIAKIDILVQPRRYLLMPMSTTSRTAAGRLHKMRLGVG
jgi:hypothetical protein